MVDTICKGNECGAWQAPSEAPCDNCQESFNVLFAQSTLILRIANAWDNMVVFVLAKQFVECLPLNLEFHPVVLDVTFKDSILEFPHLASFPQKRQIRLINYLEVGMPEGGFSLHLLVHYIENDGEIFGVEVFLEELWVFIIDLGNSRTSRSDRMLIDH